MFGALKSMGIQFGSDPQFWSKGVNSSPYAMQASGLPYALVGGEIISTIWVLVFLPYLAPSVEVLSIKEMMGQQN